MKKFIAGAVVGMMLSGSLAFAANSTTVDPSAANVPFFVDGVRKAPQYGEPISNDGRTYISIRDAAELAGIPVYWNEQTRSISIGKPYVQIFNLAGQEIGSALLSEDAAGVKIKLQVSGLTPGKHGFHVHENAFAGFDLKSAGSHLNPEGKKHGMSNPDGHHLGDLQNLEVKEDGTAAAEIRIEQATLSALVGRSLIIHAGEDDGLSDPAGNSGDRVAGGVIPK